MFDFYKKTMRSATSMHNKINLCANDLVRSLLRVEEGLLDDNKVVEVTNAYDMKLIYSGYEQDIRKKIIEGGLTDYLGRIRVLKERGGNPYLNAQLTEELRTEKHLLAKGCWYKSWYQGWNSKTNKQNQKWKSKKDDNQRNQPDRGRTVINPETNHPETY